jgi:long-chain fatty acid transport protein
VEVEMRRLALVTACAATLTPTGAWASGFEGEYPDNGARALGRGGAFVAKADDPTALYYNPAGLGLLGGTNLLLSVNLVDVTHSFQRAPDIVQTNVRRC